MRVLDKCCAVDMFEDELIVHNARSCWEKHVMRSLVGRAEDDGLEESVDELEGGRAWIHHANTIVQSAHVQ